MKVISLENLKTFYNNLEEKIDSKVDKIEGKGLSTNDYTTEDKNKLDNLVCDSLESDRGDLALSAK